MATRDLIGSNVDTEVEKEILRNTAIKSIGWVRMRTSLSARIGALVALAFLVTANSVTVE